MTTNWIQLHFDRISNISNNSKSFLSLPALSDAACRGILLPLRSRKLAPKSGPMRPPLRAYKRRLLLLSSFFVFIIIHIHQPSRYYLPFF